MYKKLFFFLLVPVLGMSQVQIGVDIDGDAPDDHFGYGVAMSADGSVIAVGAPFNDGNGTDAGHVKVYSNASGTWTQIGDDIEGKSAGDQSGFRVALSADGSIVAIGAPYNCDNCIASGQVRVYQNISGVWTQIGQDIDNVVSNTGLLGHGVALSGDGSIVAIGIPSVYGYSNAKVYQNVSGVWTQLGAEITDPINGGQFDRYGWYVALSKNGLVVAVGAI